MKDNQMTGITLIHYPMPLEGKHIPIEIWSEIKPNDKLIGMTTNQLARIWHDLDIHISNQGSRTYLVTTQKGNSYE